MVFESILTSLAGAVVNTYTYWILAALFASILYFFLSVRHTQYALVISMLVPVLFLEFILRAVFGFIGIPLDFGTYPLNIPLTDPINISTGAMLWRFLDFVFNFGLFRNIGVPIIENALSTVTALPEPSILLKIFVRIYVTIDTFIEWIFFYYMFKAIIIIFSDALKKQADNAGIYAAALGAVPVLLYSTYISNPLAEYNTALPEIQKVQYFLGHSSTWEFVLFTGTLLISFFLVMEILAAVVAMFYQAGSSTFRPDWIAKQWETNVQGVGFIYTLAFAIMYAMHQYSWYIFFPAMTLYALFKKAAGGAIAVAKEHEERTEMRDYIGFATRTPHTPARKVGDNTILYLLGLITVAMGGLLAWNMGWV